MKLILQRNQKKGIIGGTMHFKLSARAELTAEEAENIKKYKMGDALLFTNVDEAPKGLMAAVATAVKMINISVNDLVRGKELDCKDINEMIAMEYQIKEACAHFKQILDTAAQFGGDEVIEY